MLNDSGELEQLQRETNDALGRLVLELREGPAKQSAEDARGTLQQDAQSVSQVTEALRSTTSVIQQISDGIGANASALKGVADAFASGGQGLLGGLASGLEGGGGLGSILRSGFGLAPLAGALAGLFGGGDREEQLAYEQYLPPPPIRLEAATTPSGGFGSVVRGSGEQVRVVESRSMAPQVVVNVSAMDSQSFLTRSHDIARAVRDAMIHMDPLNDVIAEL